MRETRSDIGETVIRIGKALFVYLLVGGGLIGLIFWLTRDFESASLTLRSQFTDAEDAEASVMAILDQARLHLFNWTIVSLVISWICAGLFLSVAQRRHPRNTVEGASKRAQWTLLLILAFAASAASWWQFVGTADVAGVLVSSSYALVLSVVGLGTLLAYYLSTGLAVTMTMKPSVPLGTLLPDFWN